MQINTIHSYLSYYLDHFYIHDIKYCHQTLDQVFCLLTLGLYFSFWRSMSSFDFVQLFNVKLIEFNINSQLQNVNNFLQKRKDIFFWESKGSLFLNFKQWITSVILDNRLFYPHLSVFFFLRPISSFILQLVSIKIVIIEF